MINKMIVFQMDFVEDLKCDIELSAQEVGVSGWNKNIYPWMFGGVESQFGWKGKFGRVCVRLGGLSERRKWKVKGEKLRGIQHFQHLQHPNTWQYKSPRNNDVYFFIFRL